MIQVVDNLLNIFELLFICCGKLLHTDSDISYARQLSYDVFSFLFEDPNMWS